MRLPSTPVAVATNSPCAVKLLEADGDRLERLAREARGEVLAPATAHVEAAIGRRQRRHCHAALLQQRHPRAVGAQARPARATQRQHDRLGAAPRAHPAALRSARRPRCVQPMKRCRMWNCTPARAQPVQPGAQQRRGLHLGREDAAGSADEGRDAQSLRPVAQRLRIELPEQGLDLRPALAVTRREGVERLRVREVQAALARQQELAARRRHGVEDMHLQRRPADSTSAAISPAGPAPTTATVMAPPPACPAR